MLKRPRLDAQLETISAVKTPSFYKHKKKNRIKFCIGIGKLACVAFAQFILYVSLSDNTGTEPEDY